MAEHEYQHSRRPESSGDGDAVAASPQVTKRIDDAELDSLLGDIDDALETNAETFVKNFQQKGGQ